jgi:hypothetical protein
MPMFYGQIMMQNYLSDPSISFCAIGDETCDSAPLQVTEFGQGKEIDQLISKMWLEGGGGGNQHESYNLSAYFYANFVDFESLELPFFFVTGDEGYWEDSSADTIKKIFGKGIKGNAELVVEHKEEEPGFFGKLFGSSKPKPKKQSKKGIWLDSDTEWRRLMTKYNVFHIKKEFHSAHHAKDIQKQWEEILGKERVLNISEPKACIDVMLGAIAITSGARDLEGYIHDMKERGQTDQRIKEVTKALEPYFHCLKSGKVKVIRNKVSEDIVKERTQIVDSQKKQNVMEVEIGNPENIDLTEVLEQWEKLQLEGVQVEQLELFNNLKKLRETHKDTIPQEYICPITKQIFYDPVMTSDGITYEKKAIEIWLQNHQLSPATGKQLDNKNLLPNFAVKQLIREFSESNK